MTEFTRPEALRPRDEGDFQHETTWPPAHVQPRSYHLGADGGMDTEGGAAGARELVYRPDVGIAAGRYAIGQMLPGWGMGDDQRLDEGLSLVYTAEPVGDTPLELIGPPAARLWVRSTAGVAFVSVKLCDVAPDGTSQLVSKGVLNLTHRGRPQFPELLVPGEVYEVAVPLVAAAHRFLPGHRVRVMIAAADFQNAWPTPQPHTLTVLAGPEYPSRLELSLAGTRREVLPPPQFLPSDFPPLPRDQLPTPEYTVTRDFIQNAVTVHIRTLSGIGVNRSDYTVHIDRPAEAAVRSDFEYPVNRPGQAILVRAQCVTRSDAAAFHQVTQVEIAINGRPHWSKSWQTSVPREGC